MELTKQVKITFVVTAVVDLPSPREPHQAEGYAGALVESRIRSSLQDLACVSEQQVEFDSIVHNP